MKIVIIGAGITGITAAYYLAREGFEVSVYEQEPHAAMRCSYANGGQISVSNSEVWTTWSNVYKGLKWMFKKDAPLLVRPSLDIDKAVWLLKFLKHTAKNDYFENTKKTIHLGLESRIEYAKIIKEENLDFSQSNSGILHFYKDEKYFESAKQVKEIYNECGCEWDILSTNQVLALDPAISNITGIIGGAWTPSDWTGDIHQFCTELEKVLKRRYKVKFFYNVHIDEIEDLSYDKIVIAGGVGSNALSKIFADEKLPIYPVKGYSITVNENDEKLLPKVSLLDDQNKIVTSTLGNRFRVAGTAELAGENYDIIKDRIDPLLAWTRKNFPYLKTNNYTSWACLRPMTPNLMPIVQQSKKNSQVYYHTGHGHLGWTLSAGTAKLLTQLIKGK